MSDASPTPSNSPFIPGASGPLAGIATRYPEKTLYLGEVFADTTASYKLLWFLGILSLLKQGRGRTFLLSDIFTEMAVAAWHPVCLFRLSFGYQDNLQALVSEMKTASGLQPNATPDEIRRFVNGSQEFQERLAPFGRYVPTRFLTPWFTKELRGVPESARTRRIIELAEASQPTPLACPYSFEGAGRKTSIRINEAWAAFLSENMNVVQAFAEHHLVQYLQKKNPNVPGIPQKLHAPVARNLAAARKFWTFTQEQFRHSGNAERFRDIYADQPLADAFSIDHFLPWTYVVHDLLWNLTPVHGPTNSSKSDALPDLDLYLPRLARLHYDALEVAKKRPKYLEEYVDCFKLGPDEMMGLGLEGMTARFRDVIAPQAQIATNQGFEPGWILRN